MPAPPLKLNFASIDHYPVFDHPARPVDWQRVETVYGSSIPEAARAEIIEITNKFLMFSAFALAAPSLPEALERVDAFNRHAGDLLATACDRSGSYAEDRLIDKHLQLASAGRYDLTVAADLASCLKAACANTKRELEKRASNGLSADAHWKLWVRRLIEIVEKYSLPHRVRKDRRKHGSSDPHALWKPSPFVRLIKALQNYLPAQYRKTASDSDDALSQAINLARAEYRLMTKSGN